MKKSRCSWKAWQATAKPPPSEIQQALFREQSEEERIQAAYLSYKSYNASRGSRPQRMVPIPASRQLEIGQRVQLGYLHEPLVVALFEEGQVVVLRHLGPATRGAPPTVPTYGAWPWHETVPLSTMQQESRFSSNDPFSRTRTTTRRLGALISMWLNEGLKDVTEYQRDYVWTDQDKDLFLDAILAGAPLGAFVILQHSSLHSNELLDGKQRLNCLVEFVTSQRAYRGVYWHQLNPADRYKFEDRNVPLMEVRREDCSPVDICDIFLAINAGGVPQTQEHLEHVRQLRERLVKASQGS